MHKLTRLRRVTLKLQEGECTREDEDEADVGGKEDGSQKEQNMAEIRVILKRSQKEGGQPKTKPRQRQTRQPRNRTNKNKYLN